MSVGVAQLPALRWPDVSLRALRVWQRNRDVYLKLWKSEVVWPAVEPFVALFALGAGLGDIVELDSGQRYIEFIAPGLVAVWPTWAAAGECGWGSFFRMENQKTFEAIVATPVSIGDVITGEVLWGATRALMNSVYILAIIAAWGLVDSPLAVLMAPLALLSGLMFASIALSYTSIAKSISSLNYFFGLFMIPQFWVTGVFFPLEQLPAWAQRVAWWMPATHVVDLYRGLIQGSLGWSHLEDVAWMAVVAAIFYAVALFSMRRRLVK